MTESYIRGHKIIYSRILKKWVYADNMKSIGEDERACTRCGKSQTINGHDACLGNIPKVIHACCGHGIYKGYMIHEKIS